jgi:hypothetical protein
MARTYDQSYLEVARVSDNGQQEPAYRVHKFIGSRKAESHDGRLIGFEDVKALASKGRPVLTVVNGQDLFRSDTDEIWAGQSECAEIVRLAEEAAGEKHFVILKSAWPNQDIVWDELLELKERLLIILNADDLRMSGLMISRGISWDATALDVVAMLRGGELKQFHDSHVIIRFGLDGAMYCHKSKASFFYDPIVAEGEYSRKFRGTMSGFGCVFCASLAIDFEGNFDSPDTAIRQALVSSRRLLQFGYKLGSDRVSIDHYEVFDRSDFLNRRFAKTEIDDSPAIGTKTWGFLFLNMKVGNDLENLATEIVNSGNIPPDRYGVPHARLGKLETLDRSEIESYRGIQKLLAEYLEIPARKSERPLSIGVFGQPGTGKSFGVREVARSLDSDKIELGFVFNLAQFTSVSDLTSAFHSIRDAALKGKIPLVFFDEFDCNFGPDPLGWLKYFLAPMQDGEFKEGELTHPIGKAVMVFAGGLSHSFEDFCRQESFKAKLPDFISRLRGHVNIIGPDKHERDGENKFYIVRRAILLRSLLVDKCNHLLKGNELQIDDGVLNAFLHVSSYRHGVRSMEAIIDMSVLSGKKRFDRSALPTTDQLNMHVDAAEFNALFGAKA